MTSRALRRLAWVLVGIYVFLASIGLIFQFLTRTYLRDFGLPALLGITVVAALLYVLAALIVWRHPRHPIGWLLCAVIIVWEIDLFSFGYAYYGLVAHPGSLPGSRLMLVWQAWSGGSFVIVISTLIFLLFPDGRPLSPRWGRVGWVSVGTIAVYLALDALEPGPLEVFPYLPNPFGVSETLWAVLNPLRGIALILGLLCLMAAVLSLVLRLNRARGDEGQQLKWLIYPAGYFALTLVFVFYAGFESNDILLSVATGLHSLSLLGLFIAIALAIFRYRLYDIDLIINRTLVYSALTGTLALVYFVSVILLQRIFPAESQLAVVLSTLTIAALFSPLRRRIQDGIDRRFYRRRYDAERAVDNFSAAVRDQVKLESLSTALLIVVEETVQPSQIELWLRQSKVQTDSGVTPDWTLSSLGLPATNRDL